MMNIVDVAASRARMVLAFIALSILAGGMAYFGLPKEGEPDIEIPIIFVSVPFPGISAEDSETLLVRPMEAELQDIDGLQTMTATASENYAGVALEFDFGWNKTETMADIRDAMTRVEGLFPDGADNYSINEINFSEFPIAIVNLTGNVPERTLIAVAKDLQDAVEGIDGVLEASLTGQREEMIEVIIDPLRLEAYNVTAGELIDVVTQNNLLIAAGEVETDQGSFAVKIPSSFDEPRDIYDLPVKTNGDRVITLGDLAEIRLTFEDRTSTARFNGTTTVALQIVKRRGFNLIDTAQEVRDLVDAEVASWPQDLQDAVQVGVSNDQSRNVDSMVRQLEGSVLTAIALVMIVVLAALGTRPALLVGFAIPTSFLLCFAFLAVMEITISNIVMFGLILAVGMLVDGAIVVVEFADRRIREGAGPMAAYTDAAKRMFWPIVSSTATTLCAFLPMLFWPGVPGQFMGMLPVTIIFVLSASLVVALIYLPVLGGVTGRMSRAFGTTSDALKARLPWFVNAALVLPSIMIVFTGAMLTLNPGYLTGQQVDGSFFASLPGMILFLLGTFALSITVGAAKIERKPRNIKAGYRRSIFGRVIHFIAGNPIMPIVAIGGIFFVVMSTFTYFGANNNGVEFFVESEPEQAIVYVQARGNLSVSEKDDIVAQAEAIALREPGVQSIFAFAGAGGLNQNTGGGEGPRDTIGQLQIELVPWEDRPAFARANDIDLATLDGDLVMERLQIELETLPGIRTEILNLSRGPASAKPVHLRLTGDNWADLRAATTTARAQFEDTTGLIQIEDSLPLPGIDWEITVDVEQAGRYGANVAAVGGMVQLVTRGILLDTMRVDSSDEEIEIRVRLPEQDRVLSTLDSLRVRTNAGLVPLSNFITRTPVPELSQIDRIDQSRYFDIKAAVEPDLIKFMVGENDEQTMLGLFREIEAETSTDATRTVETPDGTLFDLVELGDAASVADVQAAIDDGDTVQVAVNGNERIEALTAWLETDPLPASINYEWTGDQEDQAESGAFLAQAFLGALGLMFIILLAQFNSVYNSILVLLAVVLSTTGVLIGMLVMDQAFSIIMTGTGIVALAGIVVNNNIVLIDTYQEYERYMPRTEAITRTAEDRIRPVLLTTITTMAGLAPMMFGLSLDFIGGGFSVDSPTSLWWKQLATAVVFGLGIATVLTLVFTPSMLALRVWVTTYARWAGQLFAKLSMGTTSRAAQDWALSREAKRIKAPEIIWDDPDAPIAPPSAEKAKAKDIKVDDAALRAAE
ncbi:efflux RND transporter permease subunit [Octadecabacter sp. 1_MG-2023]|uniref:efflux RND transporter permease subunit n=1 Tax=unclassified Octadecabacter TaxID=196158 RepID=UPI001C084869|nr:MULTISPECIES: efflux RND transporter permease subunit [unclassified Octadecabacter]MBU2993759.1 efflux RND transporter permease subunit [Octadecabacter sp. B2R22]MDO6735396.1 efflux RND transporter permease subunit [Octadecabacter sp. 1_MG-2023]